MRVKISGVLTIALRAGYTFIVMKRFFKKVFGFCGAIVVLVLMLGTFCADQFAAKDLHHSYVPERVTHIETQDTMCHRGEASTVAISPRSSESSSEKTARYLIGKTAIFTTSAILESKLTLAKFHLSTTFGFGKHREIRDVILRS